MTKEQLDRTLYAAALNCYRAGDYQRAWRLCVGNQTSPASIKLKDMALRRMLGLGPAERFPISDELEAELAELALED